MEKPQPVAVAAAARASRDDLNKTGLRHHHRPSSLSRAGRSKQRTHARLMRRVLNLQFRDELSIAVDIDSTCWFSTFAGAAIEFQDIADRRGDDR
jgi:hypothetical protein